jgi:protein-disulfide isomerase
VILLGGVVVGVIAVVLSLTLRDEKPKPTTNVTVDLSSVAGIEQNGLVLGNPDAKVTLTEYIDTSCPVCKNYVLGTFPTVSQKFIRTGKVKLDARVLAFVGASSPRGRQLVLAAAKQNKAWQLAELLYQNQGDETQDWLTDDLAQTLAKKVPGLDVSKLFTDASSASVAAEAATADSEANADGVQGTPTFVLTTKDGRRHMLGTGSPGYAPFARALNHALAQ